MGIIGKYLGKHAGGFVGRIAGKKLGRYTGVGEARGKEVGHKVGELLGDLAPFKKGGRVRKTGPIKAHKGEFVLPKGVKPTKKQIKQVRKRGGHVGKDKKRR